MEGLDYRRKESTKIVVIWDRSQNGQKGMQLGCQRKQVDDQHV
jgi:hypothetical protein